MAVTNLTKKQPDHCKRIAEFAIDAIRVANQTLIDKEDPTRGFVNIRVGFHSGPVVSNVVGSRNPRFCLVRDNDFVVDDDDDLSCYKAHVDVRCLRNTVVW